jgi:alanine-synthesizing transaminase
MEPAAAARIVKSSKLADVCYDIRGPVLDEANRLEADGHRILKLNIGNPAPFGFDTPDEILHDVKFNLAESQGYCESLGLFPARKAVQQYSQQLGIPDVTLENIFIGNGVSELIVMALQGLVNNGDEVLIPAPDYPLWTAATNLAGGRPVHYRCDEQADWSPDLDDIRSKITTNTTAMVIINPNNPTGAVYNKEVLEGMLEIARQHQLVVFADEIYDKILYDDAEHQAVGALANDLLIVTMNGLSKTYRAAGFRSGWMIVSGAVDRAADYLEGLNILASMRLCANVPAQHAIQTALGGYQSIQEYIVPGGRLWDQREVGQELLSAIPGVSCVKPKGALYFFPKLDTKRFNITDDEQFVLDLLKQERILVVQGTAFNWPDPDHFRIVFLPNREDLTDAIGRLERFLSTYRQ